MRIRAGERIDIRESAAKPTELLPEAIPLAVVYEDDALLVVDKPAGLVVHPAPGHAAGTLVHALLAHCPQLPGIGGSIRPGIVHRLDKDTSGLMVIAKRETAMAKLAAGFRAERKEVVRTYLAIVAPAPAVHTRRLETGYRRDPKNRKKWTSRGEGGKKAVTVYRVVEKLADGDAALVEATLETGRTHQIRVHFRDHGFPIVGDPVYGRTPRAPAVRRVAARLARQALHAHRLSFPHPDTGLAISLSSALPADMEAVLSELRVTTSRQATDKMKRQR